MRRTEKTSQNYGRRMNPNSNQSPYAYRSTAASGMKYGRQPSNDVMSYMSESDETISSVSRISKVDSYVNDDESTVTDDKYASVLSFARGSSTRQNDPPLKSQVSIDYETQFYQPKGRSSVNPGAGKQPGPSTARFSVNPSPGNVPGSGSFKKKRAGNGSIGGRKDFEEIRERTREHNISDISKTLVEKADPGAKKEAPAQNETKGLSKEELKKQKKAKIKEMMKNLNPEQKKAFLLKLKKNNHEHKIAKKQKQAKILEEARLEKLRQKELKRQKKEEKQQRRLQQIEQEQKAEQKKQKGIFGWGRKRKDSDEIEQEKNTKRRQSITNAQKERKSTKKDQKLLPVKNRDYDDDDDSDAYSSEDSDYNRSNRNVEIDLSADLGIEEDMEHIVSKIKEPAVITDNLSAIRNPGNNLLQVPGAGAQETAQRLLNPETRIPSATEVHNSFERIISTLGAGFGLEPDDELYTDTQDTRQRRDPGKTILDIMRKRNKSNLSHKSSDAMPKFEDDSSEKPSIENRLLQLLKEIQISSGNRRKTGDYSGDYGQSENLGGLLQELFTLATNPGDEQDFKIKTMQFLRSLDPYEIDPENFTPGDIQRAVRSVIINNEKITELVERRFEGNPLIDHEKRLKERKAVLEKVRKEALSKEKELKNRQVTFLAKIQAFEKKSKISFDYVLDIPNEKSQPYYPLDENLEAEKNLLPIEIRQKEWLNDMLFYETSAQLTCICKSLEYVVIGTTKGEIFEVNLETRKMRKFNIGGMTLSVDINKQETLWVAGSSNSHIMVKKISGWAKKVDKTLMDEQAITALRFVSEDEFIITTRMDAKKVTIKDLRLSFELMPTKLFKMNVFEISHLMIFDQSNISAKPPRKVSDSADGYIVVQDQLVWVVVSTLDIIHIVQIRNGVIHYIGNLLRPAKVEKGWLPIVSWMKPRDKDFYYIIIFWKDYVILAKIVGTDIVLAGEKQLGSKILWGTVLFDNLVMIIDYNYYIILEPYENLFLKAVGSNKRFINFYGKGQLLGASVPSPWKVGKGGGDEAIKTIVEKIRRLHDGLVYLSGTQVFEITTLSLNQLVRQYKTKKLFRKALNICSLVVNRKIFAEDFEFRELKNMAKFVTIDFIKENLKDFEKKRKNELKNGNLSLKITGKENKLTNSRTSSIGQEETAPSLQEGQTQSNGANEVVGITEIKENPELEQVLAVAVDAFLRTDHEDLIYSEIISKVFRPEMLWKVLRKFLKSHRISKIPLKRLASGAELLENEILEPLMMQINASEEEKNSEEFKKLFELIKQRDMVLPLARLSLLYPLQCLETYLNAILEPVKMTRKDDLVKIREKVQQGKMLYISDEVLADHDNPFTKYVRLFWFLSKVLSWAEMSEVSPRLQKNCLYEAGIRWLLKKENFLVLSRINIQTVLEFCYQLFLDFEFITSKQTKSLFEEIWGKVLDGLPSEQVRPWMSAPESSSSDKMMLLVIFSYLQEVVGNGKKGKVEDDFLLDFSFLYVKLVNLSMFQDLCQEAEWLKFLLLHLFQHEFIKNRFWLCYSPLSQQDFEENALRAIDRSGFDVAFLKKLSKTVEKTGYLRLAGYLSDQLYGPYHALKIHIKSFQYNKDKYIYEWATNRVKTFDKWLKQGGKKHELDMFTKEITFNLKELIAADRDKCRELVMNMPMTQNEVLEYLETYPDLQVEFFEQILSGKKKGSVLEDKSKLRYLELKAMLSPDTIPFILETYHFPLNKALEICVKHKNYFGAAFLKSRLGRNKDAIDEYLKIINYSYQNFLKEKDSKLELYISTAEYAFQKINHLCQAMYDEERTESQDSYKKVLKTIVGGYIIIGRRRNKMNLSLENKARVWELRRYIKDNFIKDLLVSMVKYNNKELPKMVAQPKMLGGLEVSVSRDLLQMLSNDMKMIKDVEEIVQKDHSISKEDVLKLTARSFPLAGFCNACGKLFQADDSDALSLSCSHSYHFECASDLGRTPNEIKCIKCPEDENLAKVFLSKVNRVKQPEIEVLHSRRKAERLEMEEECVFEIPTQQGFQRMRDHIAEERYAFIDCAAIVAGSRFFGYPKGVKRRTKNGLFVAQKSAAAKRRKEILG